MQHLLLSLALQATLPAPQGPAHLIEVEGGLRALARLERLGADVVERNLAAGRLRVLADDGQLAFLRQEGLVANIEITDLAAFYAQRLATSSQQPASGSGLGSWLSPAFAQGSIGGYYSWAEVGSVLDQIHAAYPSIVGPRTSIGTSLEGREIWSVKVSDNPTLDEAEPEARIDAMHHAREPEGMQVALWYLLWLCESYGTDPLATYLVDERETWFIPVVNPDGYVHNEQLQPGGGALWRKNRRNNGDGTFGVDLNRNYGFQWGYDNQGSSTSTSSETYRGTSAESEPEVQAMVAFIAGRSFGSSLSLHTYSNLWLAPWGYTAAYPAAWPAYDEVGTLATEVNGYPHDPASILLYAANGVTVDYDHGVYGTLSWTPEIGSSSDGFWPPQSRIIPLAEENQLALARTVLAAGAWVRVASESIVEVGDGDGSFESGEGVRFDLVVRNSGQGASSPITVALSSTSPWAQVTTTPTQVPSLNSLTDSAVTQELTLLPGIPPGTVVETLVTLTVDGHTFSFPSQFVAGQGAPIASWDFEATGTEGWTVSGPNDASTGIWERGDPLGTAAQPEDDHSPAGSLCWFTGQGSQGGSLGENDVDGGTTSLTSPTLDLSGRSAATLGFWLWYSNSAGAAPGQDVFVVQASDDAGGTWTDVLTVGPSGSGTTGGWTSYELPLEQSISMTSGVQLRFQASDLGSGSIVEAALDDVVLIAGQDAEGLGQRACSPAVVNSTGSAATLYATGSEVVSDQDLTLATVDLPQNQFGYYVCSAALGSVTPPGSMGLLCLSGSIGRFRNQLQSSGTTGHMAIDVDLTQLPLSPPVSVAPGDSWSFQLWYRDDVGGPTSNFSDAVTITFQ